VTEEQAPVVEDDERPAEADHESDYDISRLMAFSDGVFAIAITLLVLSVPVPTIPPAEAMSRLPAALLDTGPRLLTFALSFFLVGFYWIRHHQLFKRLVRVDVWLLWLNLVVLFVVCLLPFSTGVVGGYHNAVIAAELYAVNLAAIALAFSALHLYAARGHQIRLQPGMGGRLVGRCFLLPLAVVAMVMVLAPLNLVLAYVIGVTAMALVGVYTALPETVRSAALRGTAPGRLEVDLGVVDMAIRGGDSMPELFRARFGGRAPRVAVTGNSVGVEYRGGERYRWRWTSARWRWTSARIALNTSIPWRLELRGGVSKLTADLTELQVTAVTFTSGAYQVDLRLPRPSGTVPISIDGGAGQFSVRRPDGVSVRVVSGGGIGELRFDGRPVTVVEAETTIQSPDYAGATDRYDLDLDGGMAQLTVAQG
jgi:uncharacterized membrane protein